MNFPWGVDTFHLALKHLRTTDGQICFFSVCYVKASYLAICLYIPWSANLFVEVIAGPESILDGVLVIRGMEVEKVHTVCPQPLKGGFQLGAHALWLQRLSIPGIGLGSYAYCE